MKWMVMLAALGLAGVVNGARAEDPRKVDPAAVTSAVASATRGETVRIVPGASGFKIYGNGKSGSVVPSASGFRIYYGGKTSNVVRSGSGWTVYSN